MNEDTMLSYFLQKQSKNAYCSARIVFVLLKAIPDHDCMMFVGFSEESWLISLKAHLNLGDQIARHGRERVLHSRRSQHLVVSQQIELARIVLKVRLELVRVQHLHLELAQPRLLHVRVRDGAHCVLDAVAEAVDLWHSWPVHNSSKASRDENEVGASEKHKSRRDDTGRPRACTQTNTL